MGKSSLGTLNFSPQTGEIYIARTRPLGVNGNAVAQDKCQVTKAAIVVVAQHMMHDAPHGSFLTIDGPDGITWELRVRPLSLEECEALRASEATEEV